MFSFNERGERQAKKKLVYNYNYVKLCLIKLQGYLCDLTPLDNKISFCTIKAYPCPLLLVYLLYHI